MIDISLTYLAVSLHEQDSVAGVFEAGLDRQLDTGELCSCPPPTAAEWPKGRHQPPQLWLDASISTTTWHVAEMIALPNHLGIACRTLICQVESLSFSRQTCLWRLHQPVAGVEWGGGTTTRGSHMRH